MTDKDIERFIFLKYEILKNKYKYYCTPKDSKGNIIEPVTDQQYDAWEDEYKELYEKLSIPDEPRVCDMVGFSTEERHGRFAKMMVDVSHMSERDYKNKLLMCKHLHNYDISIFRGCD